MKIGIYGGSFSPPHAGHVKLAKEFLCRLELDRLMIIPAGVPPHKRIDGGADGEMRLKMCRAAFLPLSDKVEVSDFEAHRTDPCYTVDTLRHFSADGELYMLCGSDMFLTLDSWRDPEGIFSLATIVCGTRSDDPDTRSALEAAAKRYELTFGARCVIMDHDPVEVSSTEVRMTLAKSKKHECIADEVYDIIAEYSLYGFDGGA